MGRAVQERERAVLRDERRAFLEIRELFDRQSLEFRLIGVRAEKTQARLPLASQSILWRKSRKSVTSISPNSFLMKVGPIAGWR